MSNELVLFLLGLVQQGIVTSVTVNQTSVIIRVKK